MDNADVGGRIAANGRRWKAGGADTVRRGETGPLSICVRALCCGKYSMSHMRAQQLLHSGKIRRNLDLC